MKPYFFSLKLNNLSIIFEDGIIFFTRVFAGIEKGAPSASKTDNLVSPKLFLRASPKDFDVDTYDISVGMISE